MNQKAKEKMMKRKWNALKARGIEPPKDDEERRKRLKESHGGT